MKNKTLLSILGGTSLCIIMLLSSCDNFLKGAQTRIQLEKAIDYANAATYPIYVTYSDSPGVVKSPAGGQANKKETDVFTVSFEPFPDYEFLNWKIIDGNTNREIPNGEYLLLESTTDSETQCTFVKKPLHNVVKLCLVPVLTERPQILSYAPVLTSNMSLRDSSIQVVFDHDMDESSIYYTQEELNQLMQELGIHDVNHPHLKSITINGQKKYYGYHFGDGVFFKNISILNNSTGENLADCYTAPVFETPRLLTIKPDENQLPPDFQQILINLNRNFFYTQDEKQICMSGSKKWIYQVNNERDENGPEIITKDPKVKLYVGDTLEELPVIAWNDLYSSKKSIIISKNNSHKLYLDILLKDEGCGLSPSFELALYNSTTNEEIRKTIDFQRVSIWDASFTGQIDLGELDESIYAVSLYFKDRRGKETLYPADNSSIYFWRDDTPPSVDYLIWSTRYTFTVKLINNYYDIEEFQIERTGGSETADLLLNYMTTQISEEPEKVGSYSVKYAKDFAGHQVDINSPWCNLTNIPEYFVYIAGRDGFSDLLVGMHEVTQNEFTELLLFRGVQPDVQSLDSNKKPTETYGKGQNYPAYYVGYDDAALYCNRLSNRDNLEPCYYQDNNGEKEFDYTKWDNVKLTNNNKGYITTEKSDTIKCDRTKNGYRLPTVDEWLYIAKEANSASYKYSGSDEIDEVAWYSGNSGYKTNLISQKSRNVFGIFDMSGNVRELVVKETSTGEDEVYSLGGSWNDVSTECEIKERSIMTTAGDRNNETGFRLVRNAQ